MRKTFAKVEKSLKIGHFYKHFFRNVSSSISDIKFDITALQNDVLRKYNKTSKPAVKKKLLNFTQLPFCKPGIRFGDLP